MKNKKLKSVSFNNRKKVIMIEYTSGKTYDVHYSQIGIRKNIDSAWIDKKTGNLSIGIKFEDGTEDYMPYDQPLFLNKDPDYLLQNQIEKLIAYIKNEIKEKGISKKYIASKLQTSDNQIQRLLDPSIVNKNLEQLYKIASILGLEFEWTIKKAS
jgi:hypothetical protein